MQPIAQPPKLRPIPAPTDRAKPTVKHRRNVMPRSYVKIVTTWKSGDKRDPNRDQPYQPCVIHGRVVR